jgi:hypothetical protein
VRRKVNRGNTGICRAERTLQENLGRSYTGGSEGPDSEKISKLECTLFDEGVDGYSQKFSVYLWEE